MNSEQGIMVFDIGGTSLRGAVYRPGENSVVSPVSMPTPSRVLHPELSAEQLYKRLLDAILTIGDKLSGDRDISAVSIAFPGPVDHSGCILAAPGIWGRNPDGPIDMIADIRTMWPGAIAHINNDLTAAGYRYLEEGRETFCLLTVSTGIGSKVFVHGEPMLGPNGVGGEIGHARVLFDDKAPMCDCGEPGHLQAVASGRGVLELIRRQAHLEPQRFANSLLGELVSRPDAVTNQAIARAFRVADMFTVSVINESITPLAAMLGNLYLALGLDRYILIGGFAFALGEAYRRELTRQAAGFCWDQRADWNSMLSFGFADDLSGLIGAGRLAVIRDSG